MLNKIMNKMDILSTRMNKKSRIWIKWGINNLMSLKVLKTWEMVKLFKNKINRINSNKEINKKKLNRIKRFNKRRRKLVNQ